LTSFWSSLAESHPGLPKFDFFRADLPLTQKAIGLPGPLWQGLWNHRYPLAGRFEDRPAAVGTNLAAVQQWHRGPSILSEKIEKACNDNSI
jgi:hypothetical protein